MRRAVAVGLAGGGAMALGLLWPGLSSPALAAAATAADWRAPDPQNVLVVDTDKGRVLVEMVPEAAPAHVERLRALARAGFYDGRTFFRVIDRFMAQTGDPKDTGEGGSDKPDLKGEFTWRRGTDSGFVAFAHPMGADLGFVGPMPAVSQGWDYALMTADHKVAAWGTYCPGVLGMARDEGPDTANSQFFLMRQAYPSLDKRYTAFGRVIFGLDVVRAIKTGEPVAAPQDRMLKVRVLADIPAGERPRIEVLDPRGAAFAALAAKARAARGADFSVCDIEVPVRVK